MIPGFNTDVEHGGVTYHVQTEDKGLETPFILSLVYQGGAILASKRAPYDDLLASGYDEDVLGERLRKQHKLICAAIRNGRVEDLKRMGEFSPISARGAGKKAKRAPIAATENLHKKEKPAQTSAPLLPIPVGNTAAQIPQTQLPTARSTSRVVIEGVADFARQSAAASTPHLALLDETEIRANQNLRLRVRFTNGTEAGAAPFAGTTVSAKILGTAFPQIELSAVTDAEGVATVNLQIPSFNKGRAVLLISAVAAGHETTLRRIIQPG